jgi:hypothetical protein
VSRVQSIESSLFESSPTFLDFKKKGNHNRLTCLRLLTNSKKIALLVDAVSLSILIIPFSDSLELIVIGKLVYCSVRGFYMVLLTNSIIY